MLTKHMERMGTKHNANNILGQKLRYAITWTKRHTKLRKHTTAKHHQ